MATTFYAPSSSWMAAPISPAVNSSWSATRPDFFRMRPWATVDTIARPSLGNTDGGGGSFAGTNPSQEVMIQMVWGPIQAITVGNQTMTLAWMGHHGATFGFHWLRGCVWFATAAGGVRGTMVAANGVLFANNNSYPANTPYSSRFTSASSAAGNIVCSDGDYVVIEVGFENQSGSTMNSFLQLGDGNGSDINSTDSTTNRNPFLTFGTSTFALLATGVPNSLMLMGAGT